MDENIFTPQNEFEISKTVEAQAPTLDVKQNASAAAAYTPNAAHETKVPDASNAANTAMPNTATANTATANTATANTSSESAKEATGAPAGDTSADAAASVDDLPTIEGLSEEIEFYKTKVGLAVQKQKAAMAQQIRSDEQLKEVQLDYENLKKRSANLKLTATEDGIVRAIEKILPVADNFRRAIFSITDAKISEGLKMIYRQLLDSLSSLGVEEIPALGRPFDPEKHYAIAQTPVKDPEQSGLVLEVFQKGYMLGARIIRHSQVKVAKNL